MIDRRTLLVRGAVAGATLAGAGAMGASPTAASAKAAPGARTLGAGKPFPSGFLWGAASSPHQTEGNNLGSDLWFLERQQPGIFSVPSGDACNSFELWSDDLDLAKNMGLNSYRFGIEWARVEPVKGQFSQAMLDHYRRIVEGCRARNLAPIVTFNHFTTPLWFAAQGGWSNPEAPELFARYCGKVAAAAGRTMAKAITINEPNLLQSIKGMLPPQVWDLQKATLQGAARQLGVPRFLSANVAGLDDLADLQRGLLAGHKAAKAAIKAQCPDLPVGVSLVVMDDQAAGSPKRRDQVREELYRAWFELAKQDDFVGVQNYERALWGDEGRLPPPKGAVLNWSGAEVWAPSLAGAVKFAHQETGVPILISEHGVGTDDDRIRARFIPESLSALRNVMEEGVPVLGYCHWALLDNFEWIFGYKPKYGLHTVDPVTFARTPKMSAQVLGTIARRNAVTG